MLKVIVHNMEGRGGVELGDCPKRLTYNLQLDSTAEIDPIAPPGMSINKQWQLKTNSRPSCFAASPEQYAKAMNAATQADMFLRQVKRQPPERYQVQTRE